MDVGSKGGSYIDNKKIDSHVLYKLKTNMVLHFALSTRRYVLQVDYRKVMAYLE